MSDPELEAIRAQRLAQMQSQFGGAQSNPQEAQQKEEKLRAQEDAKHSILTQILDQEARARLNTLMLGKPEKGKMVETMLMNMARSGQIAKKISEPELISFLENINQGSKSTASVKFDRRRAAIDSDDEF